MEALYQSRDKFQDRFALKKARVDTLNRKITKKNKKQKLNSFRETLKKSTNKDTEV